MDFPNDTSYEYAYTLTYASSSVVIIFTSLQKIPLDIGSKCYILFMLHSILPRLISSIISLLQASTLRDRYYSALNRIEILETAIEDIGRINNHGAKDPLIKGITDRIR